MKKVYLYPKVFPSENPYISDLENALSSDFEIVNKHYNSIGILDLFRYLFNTDIYYFNWIESLASRRYGKVQIVIFTFFLMIARLFRKKIIWTLHNKYTHDRSGNRWVDYMFSAMLKYSDFIPTHSMAGIEFISAYNAQYTKKAKYFIHPVKPVINTTLNAECNFDFLIWGTIWPYKGVIEFLKFLNETNSERQFRVLIVGRCINDNLKDELATFLNDNIHYDAGFYGIEQIADFANQAKYTLFTYRPESVLSSGSLMDSIRMKSIIIGPDTGAFRDLSTFPFIKVYNSFDEILEICSRDHFDKESIGKEIEFFCRNNNWDVFGKNLNSAIIKTLQIR